jgi:uncharacterized protein (UPF0332 family)
MTGDDFLTYAGKLAALHGRDPAGARSCVSRAYYGVFNAARELLEENQISIGKSENCHKKLVHYFSGSEDAEAEAFANLIGDLHERRKKADYTLSDSRWESQEFAVRSLERAQTLRSQLATMATEPRRTAVMDGIRKYLTTITSHGG